MENALPLLIQLVSGAVGGNAAGAAMKGKSLGTIGNSIAGIIGGGVGGQLLSVLGMASATGAMDASSIGQDVAGGGIGGAILIAIIGIIKNKFMNK
jgi:uncharacterized membrane protein YeaQ/YmgE (transglycosylase-associated protein family)